VTASGVTVVELQLSAAAVCSAPSQALTAWWPGDSTPASRVQGGPDATLLNGATYVSAKVADGFKLDGENDLVTFADSSALRAAHLSVSAWVRFEPGTPAAPFGREQVVLYKRSASGSFQYDGRSGAYMIYKDTGNQLTFSTTSAVIGSRSVQSTTVLEPNRFYHVAATFDGSTLRLYVDGRLEGSRPRGLPLEHGSGPLMLGGTAAAEYDARCNCTIDEPQVFGRALGADEVQAIVAAGGTGTCDTFAIVGAALPVGYVNVPLNEQLRLVGGVSPSTFSIAAGSTIPAGLTLSETGGLTGTPAGNFSFDVVAIDGAGASATATVSKVCLPCSLAPSGLIALWTANETSTDVVSNNGGTLQGATLVPGHTGRAFAFGGDGDSVQSSSQVFTTPSNTFTMEFWVQPDATRPVTAEAISGITGNGSQRYAIGADYRGVAGFANAGVSVGTNGISVFEHGPSYLPSPLVYQAAISGWTHVAVVYNNRTPMLYVNGALVRTGLQSAQSVSPSKTFGDAYGYGPFKGLLDDVAIYNRALTAAEIAALAAGTDGKCPVAGGG
jgi:hypothetical protein